MAQYEIINFGNKTISDLEENLFSSQKWLEVLQKEYCFEFYYLRLYRTNRNIHIPFSIVKNLKGSQLISLPFSDYINTDYIDKKDYLLLVNYLKRKYPTLPITLKTSYDDSLGAGQIIRKALYHTIDLSDKSKYSDAFERGLKKARRQSLAVVHYNTEEGLRIFYKLYTDLRISKFNSIPQPFSFFKTIFNVFISKGFGEIIHIMYQGQSIAALIALKNGKTLYYKFGASDGDKLYLRPNNLLFDYLIKYARNNNFRTLDLGLSGTSNSYAGLRRFKEGMGGLKKEITYYRMEPEFYDQLHHSNCLP